MTMTTMTTNTIQKRVLPEAFEGMSQLPTKQHGYMDLNELLIHLSSNNVAKPN